MTLHIHNPETDRLAHELASLRGMSVEDTMLELLRENIEHIAEKSSHLKTDPDAWEKEIAEIGRRCAALPDYDTRTPDEILYDENGLPY